MQDSKTEKNKSKKLRILQINAGSQFFGGVSAMVFNLYRQMSDQVTFDFLTPNRTTYSAQKEEILSRARSAMRAVGLGEEFEKMSPFELSGGQKRRAAIAGILAMEPEMLVLDEPTAGLDPKGRHEILSLLKKLHRERNLTIVLVSHSMDDVADCAERIIVLDHGRILYDAAPREVFSHVRELEQVGLAAPQVSYVLEALGEKGWPVRSGATTVGETRDEILRVMGC